MEDGGYNAIMFATIAKIFSSPLRTKIVKFLSAQPGALVAAADVAPIVGASRPKVLSELRSLARMDMVLARSSRTGTAYEWNTEHVLAPEISTFLEDATTPTDDEIADAFKKIIGVTHVVAAGLLADETRSPLDLLIVTRRPKDQGLKLAVKKVEALSAVPIRYAIMELKEYEDRKQAYDRLIRDTLDFKHRVVVGRILGSKN
ncbi:MAG: hypothetical protein RLZZ283_407 [Candidatus Parcubacteria bacterium]